MDIFFQRMVAIALLIISFAFLLRSLGFDRLRWRRRSRHDLLENFEENYHHLIMRLTELEERVKLIESSFIAGTIVPTEKK